MRSPFKFDRVVLALEMVLGVLPITIIGGGYSLLGILFGSASVFLAAREHALNVFLLWFGILALAASGLFGIAGLWAVMVLSAGARPPTMPLMKVARVGSIVGVLTAVVVLALMLAGRLDRRPMVVYLVVAPTLVILHRRPRRRRPA